MRLTWKQLTFLPAEDALQALASSWRWCVPAEWHAFIFAVSGDVFFEDPDGCVHWLDTGQGTLERIAATRAEFLDRLRADSGREWLMSELLDDFVQAGMVIGENQCLGYRTLPILGGDYTAENMRPMSAAAWYGFSGYLHEQIHDLPDGAKLRLTITD